MRIDEIESAIQMCRSALSHVEGIEAIDGVITPILAKFLLIEIVAKFENKFNELIKERFNDIDDESVIYFFDNERLVKRLGYSKICGVLGKFGNRHSARFKLRKRENDPEFEMYDGLITIRNSFAHGTNITTTFNDIVNFYENGHTVLDYFNEALWLPEI